MYALCCRCTNHVTRLLIKRVAVPVRCVKHVSVVCFDVIDFQHVAEEMDIDEVTACLNELVKIFKKKCLDTTGVFRARTFDQTLMTVFGNSETFVQFRVVFFGGFPFF